jgi:hypothetical protein
MADECEIHVLCRRLGGGAHCLDHALDGIFGHVEGELAGLDLGRVEDGVVALTVSNVTKEKNKVLLISGAAAADLTGKACTPNTIHWTYDT